jgi:hypothetical protein
MWIVLTDWCGLVCALVTYGIVVSVYLGFIRIGIWEGICTGDLKSMLHFLVFQYHCFLIFWSHFKTMTTEPGVLPRNVDELYYERLPEQLKTMVDQVGKRMKHLEYVIKSEKSEKKEDKGV